MKKFRPMLEIPQSNSLRAETPHAKFENETKQ